MDEKERAMPTTAPSHQVNAAVPAPIWNSIKTRAERADITPSKYASLILRRWYDSGAPAIVAADDLPPGFIDAKRKARDLLKHDKRLPRPEK